MSDSQESLAGEPQSFEEVVKAFYPDDKSEPLEAPTDESLSDEKPEEAEEELAEQVDDEAEESEESESTEETEEDEDAGTVEIDGEEHNLTDIQEWKEAHDNVKSMQADCTKKWKEAADLKKDAEAMASKNQDLALELEALLAEDEEVDLEELKEYDEVEYYKRKEKIGKRAAKLAELKANQPTQRPVLSQDELIAESKDFYAYNPLWLDGDKLTDVFKADMKVAGEYLKKLGYSQDEVDAINYSHHWKTIIDASKYQNQKGKAKSAKKKILKTPKASKPKANKTTNLAPHEIMYGKD